MRPPSPCRRSPRLAESFFFPLRQQGMLRLSGLGIVDFRARHQRLQDIGQHLRIWTGRQGRSCALRSLAAETIFMALVICRVLITLRIRRRMSRILGIRNPLLAFGTHLCALQAKSQGQEPKPYFATASLCATNCCFASLITPSNWPFSVSSRIFFSMIARSRPGLVDSTYL